MFQLMMMLMAKPELSETLLSVLLHSGTSRRSLRAGATREERSSTLGITYTLQILEEDNPVYSTAVISGLDLVKDIVQVAIILQRLLISCSYRIHKPHLT